MRGNPRDVLVGVNTSLSGQQASPTMPGCCKAYGGVGWFGSNWRHHSSSTAAGGEALHPNQKLGDNTGNTNRIKSLKETSCHVNEGTGKMFNL